MSEPEPHVASAFHVAAGLILLLFFLLVVLVVGAWTENRQIPSGANAGTRC